ncbi:hypothetical protein BC829DRAFT_387549 [Chytridium lagenaria]|nr:hypothetical protein BC829DRAFT_387549 [Chytridium lagenaria]
MQCCDEPDIEHDGAKICRNCGTVFDESNLQYSVDEGIRVDKRTGAVGGFEDQPQYECKRIARSAETILNIPGTAIKACEIYLQLRSQGLTKKIGTSIKVVIAACIYCSARQLSLPLTLHALANYTGCHPREIGKSYKRLQKELGLPSESQCSLESFLEPLCKDITDDRERNKIILGNSRILLPGPILCAVVCLGYEAVLGKRSTPAFMAELCKKMSCTEVRAEERRSELFKAIKAYGETLPWYKDVKFSEWYGHLQDILPSLK